MTAVFINCGHPRTKENTRTRADGRGNTCDRCRTCLRNYETQRRSKGRPSNFVARWPITDPTMTFDELKAEAKTKLSEVRPERHRLSQHDWSIDGDELVLRAYAFVPNIKREERLPLAPLLSYIRHKTLTPPQQQAVDAARKRGTIAESAADKIAIQLGTHPGLIWDEWWVELEESA